MSVFQGILGLLACLHSMQPEWASSAAIGNSRMVWLHICCSLRLTLYKLRSSLMLSESSVHLQQVAPWTIAP